MNRARKTSSCGCFRSAFCLLKPSTSSSSGEHGDSDKKLLSAQMSATRDDDDQANSHPSRPIKVPPLDLNGVEKKNFKTRGVRRRTSEGGGRGQHLAEVVCELHRRNGWGAFGAFCEGTVKLETRLNCLVKQHLVFLLVPLSPKSSHPQHVLNWKTFFKQTKYIDWHV
ncbi:hypothetical protein CRE_28572 [Caenorhabditis remanei]|uniref:Uncharacterized protein n=1 Tax=Caenorhabditis remanei TaxID=31234 RepID=E3LN49_CAERE|nr:hypothetical protein CRE_28572 [Caenorhabditis remanei]